MNDELDNNSHCTGCTFGSLSVSPCYRMVEIRSNICDLCPDSGKDAFGQSTVHHYHLNTTPRLSYISLINCGFPISNSQLILALRQCGVNQE